MAGGLFWRKACRGAAFLLIIWGMFAFAVTGAPALAAGAPGGRVFALSAPFLPWLAPALILAGAALQLAAVALNRGSGAGALRRRRLACCAGALLIWAGAALDGDVTVAVGEALALVGLWAAWRAR